MKLERIAVTQLPGIRPGFTVKAFGSGLNVITGPNASGKSSLVRALHHLLYEAPEPSGGALTLEANLRSAAGLWTVTRSGSQIVWQQEGQVVERPSLPAGDFLHCYFLSLDDLLKEDETEEKILDRLRRALSGGFDLKAVRSSLFDVRDRAGQTEQRNLEKAQRKLRELSQASAALERDQRQRLPRLEEDLEAAQEASARATRVEAALAWLAARQEHLAAKARLEAFPSGMEKIFGQEITRLEELEERAETLQEAQREARRERDRAQAAIKATGLADDPPHEAELVARKVDLEKVQEHSTRLEETARQLTKLKARETSAVEALSPRGAPDLRLSPGNVNQAVDLAEKLRHAERRVQELEKAVEASPPDAGAVQAHQTLAQELRRWLRQIDRFRRRRLVGGALAVLAFALATIVNAALEGHRETVLLAAGASLAGLWILWQLRSLSRERQEAERRVAETALPPPKFWTVPGVTERLKQADEHLAELLLQQQAAQKARLLQEDLSEAQGRLAALLETKKAVAAKLGFDPSVTGEGVARFLKLAEDLDRARTERKELEETAEATTQQMTERLARVASFLARFGARIDPASKDEARIKAELRLLEGSVATLKEEKRNLQEARRKSESLAENIEETQTSTLRLYEEAGLEEGDRQELVKRVRALKSFKEEAQATAEAELLERERRTQVDDDGELVRRVEEGDEAGLRSLLNEFSTRAGQLEELQKARADLQAKIDQASQGRQLEEAQLARDEAYDALHEAYEATMRATAGSFLLDEVMAEHRSDQEPAVLATARERFGRFTHHRYDLEVDEAGSFRARDTTQGIIQEISALSTGTRMQLLLAVRLAWTSELERDAEPLPLFLDEALTTSDPERFGEIARNLAGLARDEDRQVFYLSAHPADVLRWEEATGERPHHIDLVDVRFQTAGHEPKDYALPAREQIPAPEGRSPEEYAALLQVPAVDPFEDPGGIHLFYLLRDDLTLLRDLMQDWRLINLGQLETLLESDAAEQAVADPALRLSLQGRCQAARTWVRLWRRGRGRPVGRNELEASGAVSLAFIDAVTELAESVGGNAQDFIEALRDGGVSGFRRNKMEELEEWLQEEGHLDPEEPLTAEERERKTLQRMAGRLRSEEVLLVVASLEGAAGYPAIEPP